MSRWRKTPSTSVRPSADAAVLLETVIVASNRGAPLTMEDDKSVAGEAFRDIARRITGEQVPHRNLNNTQGGILRRLARRLGLSD